MVIGQSGSNLNETITLADFENLPSGTKNLGVFSYTRRVIANMAVKESSVFSGKVSYC